MTKYQSERRLRGTQNPSAIVNTPAYSQMLNQMRIDQQDKVNAALDYWIEQKEKAANDAANEDRLAEYRLKQAHDAMVAKMHADRKSEISRAQDIWKCGK